MNTSNLSIAVEGSRKEGFSILAKIGSQVFNPKNLKTPTDVLRAVSSLSVFLLDNGIPAERVPEIQKDIVAGLNGQYDDGNGLGVAVGITPTGVAICACVGDANFEEGSIVDESQVTPACVRLAKWLSDQGASDAVTHAILESVSTGLHNGIERFWDKVKSGEIKKLNETPDTCGCRNDERQKPTVASEREAIIMDIKSLRKQFDEVLQNLKSFRNNVEDSQFMAGCLFSDLSGEDGFKDPGEVSANLELSVRAAEDCIMRLGMALKNVGSGPTPYPNSYNPDNAVVDKTADGLKL